MSEIKDKKFQFEVGQKVTTPRGAGVITVVKEKTRTIKLGTGETMKFHEDKVADAE